MIVGRGLLAVSSLLLLGAACRPHAAGDHPIGAERFRAAAPLAEGPPTMQELEGATYMGVGARPVTIAGGTWRGEPLVQGSASVPTVGLARDFRRTGDLGGDGSDEAVVLVWRNDGGSGTRDYIAVMGRDEDGAVVNLATAELGDRVELRSAEIVDDQLVLQVVQAGPGDAACCPGQKMKRTFALEEGVLREIASADMGRRSIADLAGVEWVLTRFTRDEEVARDVEITLLFDGDAISGKSACNRYRGSVTEGEMPGQLTMNMPIASTMMACSPPLDEIERRYLDALQHVMHYSFVTGNLAITWSNDGQWQTMTFRDGRHAP